MACAGLLLLESGSPVRVELAAGALVCRRLRPSTKKSARCSLPGELMIMGRRAASPTSQSAKVMALDEGGRPSPEQEHGEDEDEDEDVVRVLQLSGLVVEVLEREDELDVPSAPGSFQVATYKVTRDASGASNSSSSALRDSVILTARDARCKKLWVKHIKHWNRFGWREVEEIAAGPDDAEALEAMAREFRQSGARRSFQQRRSSISKSSASKHKRRFYRAAGPIPLVPP